MTSRTHPQYTRTQVIERCACITLDDLLSRGANARNPMFKRLAGVMNTAIVYDCGTHLLEWPDGSLVLVLSQRAREFSQLPPDTITAAYRYALRGGGLIYRDAGGAGHVA
jgi:hypothetical protein